VVQKTFVINVRVVNIEGPKWRGLAGGCKSKFDKRQRSWSTKAYFFFGRKQKNCRVFIIHPPLFILIFFYCLHLAFPIEYPTMNMRTMQPRAIMSTWRSDRLLSLIHI
jgi:hypothetical protein